MGKLGIIIGVVGGLFLGLYISGLIFNGISTTIISSSKVFMTTVVFMILGVIIGFTIGKSLRF